MFMYSNGRYDVISNRVFLGGFLKFLQKYLWEVKVKWAQTDIHELLWKLLISHPVSIKQSWSRRHSFQKHGLMFFMLDCHLRPESTAAGLMLPHDGWGCLAGQKPTQHWLPVNYRQGSSSLFVSGLLRNTFALLQEFMSYRVRIPLSTKCYLFYLTLPVWSSQDLSIHSFLT